LRNENHGINLSRFSADAFTKLSSNPSEKHRLHIGQSITFDLIAHLCLSAERIVIDLFGKPSDVKNKFAIKISLV